MKRTAMAAACLLALSACDPQVPDSAAGVGFGDYGTYVTQRAALEQAARERAARDAQLASAAPIGSPEATGAPAPTATPAPVGVSGADLAAAGIGSAAITPAQPVTVGAPLSAISPETLASGGDNVGISDEQNFAAVSSRESIQSDAERLAQQRAQYQQIDPGSVPQRPNNTGPDIVAYALNSSNPVGQPLYRRTLPSQSKAARKCAGYRSDDMAQVAFLEAGGPQKDRHGIDPDGDGYACNWDPGLYRRAVGG